MPIGNPGCYAFPLSECKGELEGEHVVSESVLLVVSNEEKLVPVRGLAFQKTAEHEPKGIKSLTANVLCRKHNGALTDFDAAGTALMRAMDLIDRSVRIVATVAETIEVDGDNFERWLLKVLLGGLYSGNFRVHPNVKFKGVHPPVDWLRILYKGDAFPDGQGLFVKLGAPGEVICTDPEVLKIEPVFLVDGSLGGIRTFLFNFQFILVLAAIPPESPPMLVNALYRPPAIVVVGSGKTIKFRWKARGGNMPFTAAFKA